ncbi:MAG: hypothetical protein HYT15_04245 [Candidatus Magasanikbacteria bacterium]|nr:hypothetical protein [Candidatus Magasanikbacteria bacterium]
MSEIEGLIESFMKDVRTSALSVMAVSINSKDVEKLCEKPRLAFPSILQRFERLKPAANGIGLRIEEGHVVLLRRLGACLGAAVPGYGLKERGKWLGWARQILQHITPRPKK